LRRRASLTWVFSIEKAQLQVKPADLGVTAPSRWPKVQPAMNASTGASIHHMTAVHIRNVPEETVARLKQRAAARGHSLEAELRIVLDEAALAPLARRRRKINWPTYRSGVVEPFDRADFYPDEDADD